MLDLLFRVKFLVMSDKGPMAETEWSSETRLQQGMRPGVQGQHEAWGWAGRNGLAPSLSEPLSQPVPPPHSFPAGLGGCWSGGCSRSLFSGRISFLPSCPTHLWHPLASSAEVLQAAPGPQTAGIVVIIAILSVLLAVLLAALLALLIFTWYVDRVEAPLGGWGP